METGVMSGDGASQREGETFDQMFMRWRRERAELLAMLERVLAEGKACCDCVDATDAEALIRRVRGVP